MVRKVNPLENYEERYFEYNPVSGAAGPVAL